MDLHEVYRNSGLGKWFHGESANKTPGWDRYDSQGNIAGECGDAKEGESYSACLSKQKAAKLGKEGRANFVKRKRAAQSEAGRGEKGSGEKGKKPINVDTGASKMDESFMINESKNKPNDPEKWSECKSAAKSKFDVYPSAYANAWAAKCYKKKGGSWSTMKEETEMDNTIKNIQQLTKQNIISNLLEGKMKGGPGKASQRPKSWDKGTKSGSEKRKMREQGKREAREMNEAADAFDPKTLDAASKRPFVTIGHGDNAKKVTASEYYAHLISQKIPHHMAVEHTNLSFGMDDGSSRMRNRSDGDYVNLRDPNTGRRKRIAGHDAYDAMKDGFYESIHHRLEKSLLEGWPDRESQREHAPHELAVPDDIADYESEEKLPHDAVHAEHYEDAMKNLKDSQDTAHAKNLVMRGAIGAALGRASIGNSKDPTLRHVMSILRGTKDALDDHFKQSQSESGIPF